MSRNVLLDSIVQPEPKFTIPKLTTNDFKIKNNYYVVSNGEVFNYYQIKVVEGPKDAQFFTFEKSPPVILEGFAIVGKKIYAVPVQDLMRKIIRKSREVDLEVKDGTVESEETGSGNPKPVDEVIDTPVAGGKTVQRKDERGISREIEVEVGKAADAAWKDQVRALLVTISEEEGLEGEDWEIEDLT